jgi:GDPmannose 4,6-dehydratase
MEAAWRILQHERGDDFVVATGEAHSVAEFVEQAFHHVGLDPKKYVSSDPVHFRPTKTSTLVGDISKLKGELGFEPKIKFNELVSLMVDADLEEQRRG